MEPYKERILQFESPLLKAFDYMIRGINVRLTDEVALQKGVNDSLCHITSINEDESINVIMNIGGVLVDNIKLSSIIFCP